MASVLQVVLAKPAAKNVPENLTGKIRVGTAQYVVRKWPYTVSVPLVRDHAGSGEAAVRDNLVLEFPNAKNVLPSLTVPLIELIKQNKVPFQAQVGLDRGTELALTQKGMLQSFLALVQRGNSPTVLKTSPNPAMRLPIMNINISVVPTADYTNNNNSPIDGAWAKKKRGSAPTFNNSHPLDAMAKEDGLMSEQHFGDTVEDMKEPGGMKEEENKEIDLFAEFESLQSLVQEANRKLKASIAIALEEERLELEIEQKMGNDPLSMANGHEEVDGTEEITRLQAQIDDLVGNRYGNNKACEDVEGESGECKPAGGKLSYELEQLAKKEVECANWEAKYGRMEEEWATSMGYSVQEWRHMRAMEQPPNVNTIHNGALKKNSEQDSEDKEKKNEDNEDNAGSRHGHEENKHEEGGGNDFTRGDGDKEAMEPLALAQQQMALMQEHIDALLEEIEEYKERERKTAGTMRTLKDEKEELFERWDKAKKERDAARHLNASLQDEREQQLLANQMLHGELNGILRKSSSAYALHSFNQNGGNNHHHHHHIAQDSSNRTYQNISSKDLDSINHNNQGLNSHPTSSTTNTTTRDNRPPMLPAPYHAHGSQSEMSPESTHLHPQGASSTHSQVNMEAGEWTPSVSNEYGADHHDGITDTMSNSNNNSNPFFHLNGHTGTTAAPCSSGHSSLSGTQSHSRSTGGGQDRRTYRKTQHSSTSTESGNVKDSAGTGPAFATRAWADNLRGGDEEYPNSSSSSHIKAKGESSSSSGHNKNNIMKRRHSSGNKALFAPKNRGGEHSMSRSGSSSNKTIGVVMESKIPTVGRGSMLHRPRSEISFKRIMGDAGSSASASPR